MVHTMADDAFAIQSIDQALVKCSDLSARKVNYNQLW